MAKEQKRRSQLERANTLLLKLKGQVTENDRKEAMQKFNHNKSLISIYLNGRGTNLDTAMYLLEYFGEKIRRREQLLA